MGTDSWPPAAAVDSAGEERGGAGARAISQLGLTAGAVVKACQHRAVAVAPAHHWALPIER